MLHYIKQKEKAHGGIKSFNMPLANWIYPFFTVMFVTNLTKLPYFLYIIITMLETSRVMWLPFIIHLLWWICFVCIHVCKRNAAVHLSIACYSNFFDQCMKSHLNGVMINMLAFRPKVCWFKPDWDNGSAGRVARELCCTN